MKKEPLKKEFCGVSLSSNEVMKLYIFESGAKDIIAANVQNICP